MPREPDLLKQKKKELERLNFSLGVDNRSLSKPILLPSGMLARQEDKLEEKYDYYIERFNHKGIVDGEPLAYQGYIFWQRKQVQPSTIRGIQIYIRDVGIGLYDNTLMKYSTVNPDSRAMQMSGEIYVEEGLERALNVDRNSFRETDAHYLALQQHLSKILGSTRRTDGVMGMAVESYWIRKGRSDEQEDKEHIAELRRLVEEVSNGQFTLSFSKQAESDPYVLKDDQIVVYDASPRWPKSKAERHRNQRILVAIQVSIAVGTSPKKILLQLENLLLKPERG